MNKKLKTVDTLNSFNLFDNSNNNLNDNSNDDLNYNYDQYYENDNLNNNNDQYYENSNLNEQQFDNEFEQMKNFGLPTSFGAKKNNSSKKKKLNQQYTSHDQFNEYGSLNDDLDYYQHNEYDDLYENYDQNDSLNLSNKQNKNDSSKNKTRRQKKELKEIGRYKSRQHLLFSKLAKFKSNGIIIDDDMFYSVTPEKIAESIACYCKDQVDYTILIDGFCGLGGNLIQFALNNPNAFIIGIDTSFDRVSNAKKIAKIYNVEYQCDFICGDFFESINYFNIKPDIVFLSPPWGGIKSKSIQSFTLSDIPIDGFKIFEVAKQLTNNISYYLPRNTDIRSMRILNEEFTRIEIEYRDKRNGFGNVLAFYFGDLVNGKEKSFYLRINVNEVHLIDQSKVIQDSKDDNYSMKYLLDFDRLKNIHNINTLQVTNHVENYYDTIKRSIEDNRCILM